VFYCVVWAFWHLPQTTDFCVSQKEDFMFVYYFIIFDDSIAI